MSLAVPKGQGSIWRRWDPHVHFPGTVSNDQFKDLTIAGALERLASLTPSIEVVGVTDYCTTRGYRAVAEVWHGRAGSSITYLFPNVEFRLDTATTRGRGINIHLMCPPEQVDELDAFIGSLDFTYLDRTFRADAPGLMALGRAFANDQNMDDQRAFETGAQQFKINFRQLKGLLNDQWAVEHCLVAVAGSRGDGTSGMQTEDNSFAALRQSIERASDIIFSPTPQQVAFWLGRGVQSESEIERNYRALKPCLHGSDAHQESTLGAPTMADRLTWLKGDSTFDTLRMACLAPATRAHIGAAAPATHYSHGRISALEVSNASWFETGRVALNPGLVAIIGPRGSGKTALADLIAAAAGSSEPFDDGFSFLRRAAGLLAGSTATAEWTQGESTTCVLDNPVRPTNGGRGLRYLSQQFVERLCASDGVTDALLRELERVVFSAWPAGERQGATNFRELLTIRLGPAKVRQDASLEEITRLSEQLADARAQVRSIPDLERQLTEQIRVVATLQGQIDELTKQVSRGDVERLAEVRGALSDRETLLQQIGRQRTELRALQSAVRVASESMFRRYHANLKEKHAAAALSEHDWMAFEPAFTGDVDGILTSAIDGANSSYAALEGNGRSGPEQGTLDGLNSERLRQLTISELKAERDRLQGLIGLDERRTRELARLEEQANVASTKAQNFKSLIELAQGAKTRQDSLVASRRTEYANYFDALLEEETELAALYGPLTGKLESFGDAAAKLRLSVRRTVALDDWATQGERLLDLRTEGPFRGLGALANLARSRLLPAWESGDGNAVSTALHEFSSEYSENLRSQGFGRALDADGFRNWEREVYKWLYDASHVSLRYSLEYDSIDIRRLSPGTRGIVLLLLYLAIDTDEVDPLIIDQPEENLDPQSVYSELVKLFRRASMRRQIVMVTHNANLVVNTDVDQVIVAAVGRMEAGRLPEMRYASGGLENPEIRRAVCQVLEGGEAAFRQRARRLRIELPIAGPDADTSLEAGS